MNTNLHIYQDLGIRIYSCIFILLCKDSARACSLNAKLLVSDFMIPIWSLFVPLDTGLPNVLIFTSRWRLKSLKTSSTSSMGLPFRPDTSVTRSLPYFVRQNLLNAISVCLYCCFVPMELLMPYASSRNETIDLSSNVSFIFLSGIFSSMVYSKMVKML